MRSIQVGVGGYFVQAKVGLLRLSELKPVCTLEVSSSLTTSADHYANAVTFTNLAHAHADADRGVPDSARDLLQQLGDGSRQRFAERRLGTKVVRSLVS